MDCNFFTMKQSISKSIYCIFFADKYHDLQIMKRNEIFSRKFIDSLNHGGYLGPTLLLGVIGHSTMSQAPPIVFNETLNDVIFDECDER